MAYMHKETFEITQELGRFVSNPQDYFEIDDLIALPVQVLNRKGYITTGCCSGHLFDRLVEAHSPYDKEMRTMNPEHTGEKPAISRIRSSGPNIVFAEGISIPEPPPGFVIGENKRRLENDLECGVDTSDTFKALRYILEATERIYKWALNLPDVKAE